MDLGLATIGVLGTSRGAPMGARYPRYRSPGVTSCSWSAPSRHESSTAEIIGGRGGKICRDDEGQEVCEGVVNGWTCRRWCGTI
jgi:hypothetical protein